MTPLLLDSAIRAALVIAGTAMVLWLMRIRRPATRHAAWAASVIAMLLLPLWSAAGPKLSLHVLQPVPASVAAPPSTATAAIPSPPAADEPTVDTGFTQPAAPRDAGTDWSRVLVGAYLVGAVVLLLRLFVGTFYAIRLRRNATILHGHSTSDRCAAPITVGWFKATLILPRGWQHWPPAKLNAVLRHESEHARRRDPLVQWLALLNRAVFWFHPLAWWLERRLAVLAEESCDAAVLAAGHSPQEYSGYLLDLARSVTTRGVRVRAVGMAMPGSGLKERMRHILTDSPVPPVSRARIVCTAALCTASIVLFAGADVTRRASENGDGSARVNTAQDPKAAAPKFDVVSVKPCDPSAPMPDRKIGASPARLRVDCQSLYNLMKTAYLVYANGRVNPPGARPSLDPAIDSPKTPDWMRSERFTIQATTDAMPLPSSTVMQGPMLQTVLEDRFKLKVHRETREVPIFELVVAKGGSKLPPFKPGSCVPFDWSVYPTPPLERGQRRCENSTMRDPASDGWVGTAEATTLDDIAAGFLNGQGRPVVNKTGIAGLVSFRLVYADAESFVAALKDQLGSELKPAIGPHDFLVIDHVERPTPNDALPSLAQTTRPATSVAKVLTTDEIALLEDFARAKRQGGKR